MLGKVLNMFYKYIICTNNEKKVKYLKKRGAKIGKGTRFLSGVDCLGTEPYLVEIGKDCLISSEVAFFTHDGGMKVINSLKRFSKPLDKLGKIKVGDNCFIGARSTILPGVTIGNNVIVGVAAVVSKDVPDNSVVAGIPAKTIMSIDEYYEKNKSRVHFTASMSIKEKRKYCEENIV